MGTATRGDRSAPPQRRAATQEEARALSNPVRLRIIRLCKDDALTNKELATRMDLHPGSVLYHVRTLVATGFLCEEPWRPGPRGTTEKPYRSTGKSWRLDVEDSGKSHDVRRAVLDAVASELDEAGPGAVIESARMAMRLRPERLERLRAELRRLVAQYDLDEPGGEPVAMLMMLHRRATHVAHGKTQARASIAGREQC